MTSSFTVGRANLEKPGLGDDVDTWNTPVNGNMDFIDGCLSGTSTFTVTTGTVTMSTAQMRNARFVVNGGGTLVGNVTVLIPRPGIYSILQLASGGSNFTVGFSGSGGGIRVVPPYNSHTLLFSDGTNCFNAAEGSALLGGVSFAPPGAVQDFATPTLPNGWLLCNGAAVSRTTYSALFTAIGTFWGAGDFSTTFNVPSLYGQFRRTWDQTGAIDPARGFASAQSDAFIAHNHGVNDPGHLHALKGTVDGQAGGTLATPIGGGVVAVANTETNTTGISIQNSGGTETRPKNYAFLTCIKT